MLTKFQLVLLVHLVLVMSACAAAPSHARSIRVMINNPGLMCPETGANDASDICTHDAAINLTGWAGVKAIPIGDAVTCVDFRDASSLKAGRICIEVTHVAARATLTGTVNINCDLSAQTMYVNGVIIYGGANEAATIANINAQTVNTGVVASVGPSHSLVLDGTEFGSSYRVDVTNGRAIIGRPTAAAIGADAEARVTYEDGSSVTDNIWSGYGHGCRISDQSGNAIYLTDDAATCLSDKGAQIEVSFEDVANVEWKNLTNHTSGSCAGTTHWEASGIPLAFGENIVVASATTSTGDYGSFAMSVDRYGGVTITSPTADYQCTTHNSTLNLAGECNFRNEPAVAAVPVIPAVVRSDFSHTILNENDQLSINIVLPAARATLTGTIPIDSLPGGGAITVNKVDIPIGRNIPEIVQYFDMFAYETGVVARSDANNHLVLTSLFCGSISRIEVIHGASILGVDSASVVGTDAIADVADLSGASVTDGLWDSGIGSTLCDSYGDSILLGEAAASSVADLGVALLTQYSPSSVLRWQNMITGASGMCVGVTNWSADGVSLAEGYNDIRISADDGNGNVAYAGLSVTRFIPYGSISEAIKSESGLVSLRDMVVTAGTEDLGDRFYVEDTNRTAGLAVFGKTAKRGDKLTLDGQCWPSGSGYFKDCGIWAEDISDISSGAVQPLGARNKTLAKPDGDIRMSGLLVRAWGRVRPTQSPSNSFIIDDGSGTPLICQLPYSVHVDPSWRFVGVTGVATSYADQRVIRVRDANDVVPF